MEDDALKGDKAKQDHWIFQQAATWPDIIRKNKTYDRPEWHYIDIPQYLDPSDQHGIRQAVAGEHLNRISGQYSARQISMWCRPSHYCGQHSRARPAPT